MVSGVTGEPGATFFALTPDRVLDAVEVGGLRCTGRCMPLRAFENRVYEVELEDERRLVVKFYRPGRWSRETILGEHAFLAALAGGAGPRAAARGASRPRRTGAGSPAPSAACTRSAPRATRRAARGSIRSATSSSRSR